MRIVDSTTPSRDCATPAPNRSRFPATSSPRRSPPRIRARRIEQMIRDAKEEIAAGEIFQIVLSQRWETDYPTHEALTLYRALRSINPSPYMFLLRTNECTLVGASPEMLVRVTNGTVETRPIAGTRPRGASHDEDLAFRSRAPRRSERERRAPHARRPRTQRRRPRQRHRLRRRHRLSATSSATATSCTS